MASRRHERRRACESKLRFATQAEAIARIEADHLRGLAPYRCRWGHWHLGHGPHLERAEMKALRQSGGI